jgi:hypothetical protein
MRPSSPVPHGTCLLLSARENVAMSVDEFRNHDGQSYLRGVADHYRGYVINI